jgi:hypothetical protein
MGIGVSVFLMATGAILKWAVEADLEGVNLDVVGVILMIAGALGLLMSLLFWSSFSPYRRDRRDVVVQREREIV